ncbi:MAG: hypothetical protein PWP23_3246 [Candidatus Sumerlaeota bacterium]|nr:hypothetical protein [Candidatus Sumerlaeota bacterium]
MKNLMRALAFVVGIVLLGGVMAWFAGVFEDQVAPGTVAPPAEKHTGTEVTVRLVEDPIVELAAGTVRAREETVLSSRIAARIESVAVRSGDSVKAGDVLIRLDERDLRARVDQARQSAEAAIARHDEARSAYARARELFDSGVNSRAELERAEADVKTAEADLTRARRAIDEAEATLSFAVIESPIDGVVIDRYAEPGDIASPGMTLVRLYDPASLRLEADVRESLAGGLRPGSDIAVRIDSLGREIPGIVQEIVPASDPGSRSFVVKIALSDPTGLYPGMFGRLLIPRGTRSLIVIPASAVERIGQVESVYLAGETTRRRMIRTGATRSDGTIEVVSGLAPGDVILQ